MEARIWTSGIDRGEDPGAVGSRDPSVRSLARQSRKLLGSERGTRISFVQSGTWRRPRANLNVVGS